MGSANASHHIARTLAGAVASAVVLVAGLSCGGSHQATSATAHISGEKGGYVRLTDGAMVVVPAHAFRDDTSVRIARISADDAHGGTPDGWTPAGARYEISLGDAQPRIPVRIELPVDAAHDAADGRTFLAYFDETQRSWVPVGGELNAAEQQPGLGTETSHASWWSIFTQTDQGAKLWGADRRIVYLPSNNGDPLELCPWIAPEGFWSRALGPANPCYSDQPDTNLDPINLVFYGISASAVSAVLEDHGWRPGPVCPTNPLTGKHVAYGGVGTLSTVYYAAQEYISEGCPQSVYSGEWHVRIFEIAPNWTVAAAHFEIGLNHAPTMSWKKAAEKVSDAFTAADYHIFPNRLLIQRDCSRGCVFREQPMDGWVTLITRSTLDDAIPSIMMEPTAGPVGTSVTVELSGFPPSTNVDLYGDAGRVNQLLQTVHTDAGGKAKFPQTVPATYSSGYGSGSVPHGIYVVRAEVADNDTIFAEGNFTVTSGAGTVVVPPTNPVSAPGQLSPPGHVDLPPPSPVSGPGRPAPPTPLPSLPTVGPPTPLSAPGGPGPSCPAVSGGHWSGTWSSTVAPFSGTWDLYASVSGGGQISGTAFFNGSVSPSGGTVQGAVTCDHIVFGDVTGRIAFTGTASADGRTASGTWASSSDHGTWSGSLR